MQKNAEQDKKNHSFWLKMNASAIFLTLVVAFTVYNTLHLAGATYEEAHEWLSHPYNRVISLTLLAGIFYHASLGMKLIVRDHIAAPHWQKKAQLVVNTLSGLFFLATLLALLSFD